MLSYNNPVEGRLTPNDIDRGGLLPQKHLMPNGKPIFFFPDNSIELVRFDFVFEAGTALQQKKLQSAAAIMLLTAGTRHHTARQIAEFMDFRGIALEQTNDSVSATLTVYSHVRYAKELLPLLHEMITESTYPDDEFDIFRTKRKQRLLVNMQQTSYVARMIYYDGLFGRNHPLGAFAEPEDIDLLSVDDVRSFHRLYHTPSRLMIVAGGNVGPELLSLMDCLFGSEAVDDCSSIVLPEPMATHHGLYRMPMPGAVQNTLRVGRLLPLKWNDMDYAHFMVLNTVLGGYFGSRLMSNLREDKGYTYGINSMTQIYRGFLVFHIITDVASDKSEAAIKEILKEMQRLCDEPVGDEELMMVRSCMLGDFMRSIDGVFERCERFCQMMTTGVSEVFTDNFMSVLTSDGHDGSTPQKLQSLAQSIFSVPDLVMVSAGAMENMDAAMDDAEYSD